MTKRRHSPGDYLVSPPFKIDPVLSGNSPAMLAKVFAPEPIEIRRMLLALRKHHAWSQEFAAVVLGVTKSAIVKWEAGDRLANGAAAKMIFLLHSLLIDKTGKVKNCIDLAYWGKWPQGSEDEFEAALKLAGTFFVPEETMLALFQAAQAHMEKRPE